MNFIKPELRPVIEATACAVYETFEQANVAAQLLQLDTGLPRRAVKSCRQFGMWVVV